LPQGKRCVENRFGAIHGNSPAAAFNPEITGEGSFE
jgi:hypothetical protein